MYTTYYMYAGLDHMCMEDIEITLKLSQGTEA